MFLYCEDVTAARITVKQNPEATKEALNAPPISTSPSKKLSIRTWSNMEWYDIRATGASSKKLSKDLSIEAALRASYTPGADVTVKPERQILKENASTKLLKVSQAPTSYISQTTQPETLPTPKISQQIESHWCEPGRQKFLTQKLAEANALDVALSSSELYENNGVPTKKAVRSVSEYDTSLTHNTKLAALKAL
ncbi:hypothetical protein FBULB1_14098 [Fusarium bulbicola]|nr:hypothetical protein FBULB1_14098 [Fusarium bulbicola]